MAKMELIGLIGGMSWQSSAQYYRLINQRVQALLGGQHSAEMLLYSVDFDPLERAQHAGDWTQTAQLLSQAAIALRQGGAKFLVLCTNTMHRWPTKSSKPANYPCCTSPTPPARPSEMQGQAPSLCLAPDSPWRMISIATDSPGASAWKC